MKIVLCHSAQERVNWRQALWVHFLLLTLVKQLPPLKVLFPRLYVRLFPCPLGDAVVSKREKHLTF